jgi:uncharacterized protein YggE
MNRMLLIGVLMLAPAVGVSREAAAQVAAPLPPQIVTTGTARVEVSPDRAELLLAVETRGATGALAGEENARVVTAILDSLRRGFGLTDRDLATQGYSLQPQMVYERDKAPRVEGYRAVNMIRVRADQIAQVGGMIDAALKKGATNIAGLQFTVRDTERVRREALAAAVAQARGDAEAMAAAAGGRLGALIELVNGEPEFFRPQRMEMAMAARGDMVSAAPTPIQVGEQEVVARVNARWVFEPGVR